MKDVYLFCIYVYVYIYLYKHKTVLFNLIVCITFSFVFVVRYYSYKLTSLCVNVWGCIILEQESVFLVGFSIDTCIRIKYYI